MRARKGYQALLMGLVCMGVVSGSAAKDYKVYFLGGQSNMEGYGYSAQLQPELGSEMAGVYIFHGNPAPDGAPADGRGVWTPLRPGHGTGFASDGHTNRYSDRFGIEMTFAQRLREADPSAGIAFIKYARGGASIDTAAAETFGSFAPDFRSGNGVNQYDHLLATIRNAFSVRDIDGDGTPDRLIPAGIVWMQGESDGAHGDVIARRYPAALKQLVDLIRAALWTDDLPVVIGRISDSGQDADGRVWDQGDLVREGQALFVRDDAAAALVTSTDRYAYSDRWHYDSAGYLDLGRQFADAMLRLQKEAQEKR